MSRPLLQSCSIGIVAFIFLAGCATTPVPPVPSPADPDAALSEEYADVVLAETPERQLKVLCDVVGKVGNEAARKVFIKGYKTEITADSPPPDAAWKAYYEKLYMICIERGWWS